MSSLKIALIQTPLIWENPQKNRDLLREKIMSIEEEVDLILLPEMFTTGFTMNTDVAEAPYSDTHRWMAEMSARTKAVLAGSYAVNEGGMYFNRLIWMEPDGGYQQYNKKHLFRMADEHTYYTAGNTRLLTSIKDWKVLPLVCYDLRFPAWCRNHYHHSTKELDYDLILFVANWPSLRSEAWDSLLKSRAIENHAYSVGVNRLGSDGNGREYIGHSAVYHPKGDTIAFSEKEEIIIAELFKSPLEEYRKQFPAYLDSID